MRLYRLLWSSMCAVLAAGGALRSTLTPVGSTWILVGALGVVGVLCAMQAPSGSAPGGACWDRGRALDRRSVVAAVAIVGVAAAAWRGSPVVLVMALVVAGSAPAAVVRCRRWMQQPVDGERTRWDKLLASMMYTCPEYGLYAREPWCVAVGEPGATWVPPAPAASAAPLVRSRAQLLRQWRHSALALQHAEDATAAAQIVEERQRTLEELASRDAGAVSWRLARTPDSSYLLPFPDTNAERTTSR